VLLWKYKPVTQELHSFASVPIQVSQVEWQVNTHLLVYSSGDNGGLQTAEHVVSYKKNPLLHEKHLLFPSPLQKVQDEWQRSHFQFLVLA